MSSIERERRETGDFRREPDPIAYNYRRLDRSLLIEELQRVLEGQGLQPGEEAPDFELVSTEADCVRLSSLRGRPVVLRFASVT